MRETLILIINLCEWGEFFFRLAKKKKPQQETRKSMCESKSSGWWSWIVAQIYILERNSHLNDLDTQSRKDKDDRQERKLEVGAGGGGGGEKKKKKRKKVQK